MNYWKISTVVLAIALGGVLQFQNQSVSADQPHMESALESLKSARDQLAVAIRDKNGHRAKAHERTVEAIKQTEEGIKAGEE